MEPTILLEELNSVSQLLETLPKRIGALATDNRLNWQRLRVAEEGLANAEARYTLEAVEGPDGLPKRVLDGKNAEERKAQLTQLTEGHREQILRIRSLAEEGQIRLTQVLDERRAYERRQEALLALLAHVK